MERASESLMLSTYTHTIRLGSERPTLNAYPCQFALAQCREIVDKANAMDRSVAARWVHVGVLGRQRFRRTPSASDADTRPRPTICARRLGNAKIVAMLLL